MAEYRKYKILLVEDEESLAMGLEYNFNEEGYDVIIARNGNEAIEKFNKAEFDLMVLDIMLPFLDGFEILKIVREKDPRIPVLILTAKTGEADKVKGLERGADDYLTKPFHLKELLLRVKGMLKRKTWYKESASINPVIHIGENKIDFELLSCSSPKGTIRFTQNEIILLKYLVDKKGKVVSREELLKNVWNINPDIETRTIDIFISRLRKYLEKDPSKPQLIKSVRGAGYILDY